jgi:hypothetical protein
MAKTKLQATSRIWQIWYLTHLDAVSRRSNAICTMTLTRRSSAHNCQRVMCLNQLGLGECHQRSLPTPRVAQYQRRIRMPLERLIIIVGDVVILDSKVSGIIPADIILFETSESEEFVISNYSESFDP